MREMARKLTIMLHSGFKDTVETMVKRMRIEEIERLIAYVKDPILLSLVLQVYGQKWRENKRWENKIREEGRKES